MLLLELIETLEEPPTLAAGASEFGSLQKLAQLGSGTVDDRGRQNAAGDSGQDLVLDEVGGAAAGAQPSAGQR
jgi:hypothetical protein